MAQAPDVLIEPDHSELGPRTWSPGPTSSQAPIATQTSTSSPFDHLEVSVEARGSSAGARSMSPVFSQPPPRPIQRRRIESPLVTGTDSYSAAPQAPLQPAPYSGSSAHSRVSGPATAVDGRARTPSRSIGPMRSGSLARSSVGDANARHSTQSTSGDDEDEEAICSRSVARESLLARYANSAARTNAPQTSLEPEGQQQQQEQQVPQSRLVPSVSSAPPAEATLVPALEQPSSTASGSTKSKQPEENFLQPAAASLSMSISPPAPSLLPAPAANTLPRLEIVTTTSIGDRSGPALDTRLSSQSSSPGPISPTEVPLEVAINSALSNMDVSQITIDPPLLAAHQPNVEDDVKEADESITLLGADVSASASAP